MDARPRWGSLVAVLFVMAVAPLASAQPATDTALQDGEVTEAYEVVRASFESDRDEHDVGPSLLRFLYSALEQMSGVPVEEEEQFQVCVALVGTGGTPRLDGGGSLLSSARSYRPSSPPPGPVTVTTAFPSATTEFVIVDEFDLVALAVSVHLRLEDADGGFETSQSWPALYGFRVDVTGKPRLPEATLVPHGHLVAFHLLAHFPEGTFVTGVVLRSERHLEMVIQRPRDPEAPLVRLHLVDVDFGDVETIRDAVKTYGSAEPGIARSVVMSWGLVDCALALRYTALPDDGSYATLAEYLTATLAASTDSGLTTLLRGLCASFEGSIVPLFADGFSCAGASPGELALIGTLAVLAEGDVRSAEDVGWTDGVVGTRFYASAGNQALGFPMPPAAWPDVVGVEACTMVSSGDRDGSFSNRGGSPGARAFGAWFATPEVVAEGHEAGAELGYWGTSFAAPAAALRAAADPTTGAFTSPEDANWCRD